jgi:UDP-glucuronate 4-epimerase
MSTYLVTGAAGFIASKVCEMLLADGHIVVGIDNLNDYYDVRLKDYRLSRLLGRDDGGLQLGSDPKVSMYVSEDSKQKALSFGKFTFRVLDIENFAGLDALFSDFKFDAVFNLAARAGVRYSLENPHVYLSTNTLGTLNILECMRKHGVKKHVLASTSSLYAGCPMPFTEDQPVNTPLSPYAATKKSAEMLAWTWHKVHGIDSTVLRYFTVFGPAGRPDMAPYRFVHWVATGQPIKLFGDGEQTRDFTYIDDIARGTILAAKPGGYEIINLGGGNYPISINTMIALLEQYIGKRALIDRHPFNAVDMIDTQADISKAGIFLGWAPAVSPEEGFRRTVEWYRANQEMLKSICV